ncbi:MAG: signal peptidase II [Verrucomicrobiae bacterium]|nr:signal peptidase II [Verrucomicrobiae bacterium]
MRYFLFLSLPLYVLDQITKYLILANFPDPYTGPGRPPIEVIPGFFNIVRVHNTGMAWGTLNGWDHANLLFGAIAISAVTAIIVLWRKNAFPTEAGKTSAALLISGVLGNFTDRILPNRGYVVDFLDFKLPLYDKLFPSSGGHFPSFNVADSCICIAAFLLFITAFREESTASGKAKEQDGSSAS